MFKKSLKFSYSPFFRSWTGHNCCKWEGITCNGVNSHAVKLAIPSESPYTGFYATELSASLLKLRYLNHLDLSGVFFMNDTIPEFIGEMKQLRYLKISIYPIPSYTCVLHHLGNLTNLEVLDMSRSECELIDVEWISHLRAMKHLDLGGVDLAETHGLMKSLGTLPLLSFLGFSFSWLTQPSDLYAYYNSTGMFPKLQYLYLFDNSIVDPIPIEFQNMTSVKVLNVTYNYFHGVDLKLFFDKFRDLTHLCFHENYFPSTEVPPLTVFQNITSLKVLDLSENNFDGMVPSWFGKFRDLMHLDLRRNDFQGIEGGIFSLLKSLSNLKTLELSYNQLQRDHMFLNEGESPLNKCNLEVLDLSYNNLTGPIPVTLGSLSNLTKLDLSYNKFGVSVPKSLGKLTVLQELNLSNNILSGVIPESLENLGALKNLDLHNNALNGTIPITLGQLSNLVWLDLFNNSLEGMISEVHFLNLSSLRYLNLGDNNLTLKLDHQWTPPFQLKYIGLGSCNIGTTRFPQWIQTQKEIEILILSNSSISGTIPDWLSYLNVSVLDLSHNQLTGLMPRFSPYLYDLDLSNNFISGPFPEGIGNMLPLLQTLHLNDNHVNGTIPSSLCNMKYLGELDLGRNKLSGSIPDCWSSKSVSLINFSYNNLAGVLPSSIGSLYTLISLHLNDNGFHGEIPESLANCQALVILDLGGNNFSGSIPPWIGLQLLQIQILRLRKNNFDGTIPPQLCSISKIQILDLAANNLEGTIPRCFGFLSRMKMVPSSLDVDVAPHSYLDGPPSPMEVTISPAPAPSIFLGPVQETNWHQENVVEVVKGMEMKYTTILKFLTDLDLSSNYLVGLIPKELTLLSGLLGLNLSYNRFSGNIPEKIGNMKSLESLDLSNNLISGEIPESIATLSLLSYLNLSNNNLSGQIPMGNQLQTINDPSVYAGNPLLCGDPLPNQCPTTKRGETPVVDGESENAVSEELLFWIFVMLGYTTGFWGVIGVLVLKKSWRLHYFKLADKVKDKVYVVIAVKVLHLNRKLRKHI